MYNISILLNCLDQEEITSIMNVIFQYQSGKIKIIHIHWSSFHHRDLSQMFHSLKINLKKLVYRQIFKYYCSCIQQWKQISFS